MAAVFESVPSTMICSRAVRPACRSSAKPWLNRSTAVTSLRSSTSRAPVVVSTRADHVEIARADEPRRQVAAGLAVVQVVDGRAHVLHVGRDGVADHQHLDAGDHEDHDPHPRVAEDLDELLDQHVLDAFEHVATPVSFLNFNVGPAAPSPPRKSTSKTDLAGEDLQPDALQVDALEDRHEIPRRHEVGDHLDRPRHVGDGENEAREQERRQERGHHGDLAGEQLALGDDADEHAHRQRADQEDRRHAEQQRHVAAQRHVEHELGPSARPAARRTCRWRNRAAACRGSARRL